MIGYGEALSGLVLIVTYLSIIIINYQNSKSFIFHALGQSRQ